MTISIHADHLEAAAQEIGRRLEMMREKDKHRDWRVEALDPMEIHPLPGSELAAYSKKAGASLAGMDKYRRIVREGRLKEPLLLQDLGEEGIWLNAATHDLGGSNSLALLMALREAGVKSHPALVYKEKIEKEIILRKSSGTWTLDPTSRQTARNSLKKKTKALVTAILAIGEDEMYGLALEGGRYGGGITTNQAAQIAKDSAAFNKTHAIVFDEYMNDVVDSLVEGSYEDEDEYLEEVEDAFDSFGSRAERYATGGGNHAWALGLVAGMIGSETKGGYWNCNFGSGSCPDCMDLHGQYMTAQEFADTYHQTLCDGGCNCGFVPSPGANPIPFEELEVE